MRWSLNDSIWSPRQDVRSVGANATLADQHPHFWLSFAK